MKVGIMGCGYVGSTAPYAITLKGSDSSGVIRKLIAGGMSVSRLNFSYGTLPEHEQKINTIRKMAKEMDKPVAIMQDLAIITTGRPAWVAGTTNMVRVKYQLTI